MSIGWLRPNGESQMASPQRTTTGRVAFTDQDKDRLSAVLFKIADVVSKIEWEFENGKLLIWGLDPNERIEICHPRAARAFLDAWLMGYERGFGDGRLSQ